MKRLLVILITTLGFGQINWDIEIVDSIHTFDGGIGYASLKLDSLTSPQIVYYQVIETYNDTGWAKVIYSYKISNEWVKETVDSSYGYIWTNYYMYPSLCLDRYDNPHIAYVHRKEDNTCRLRYANKVSGNWSIQELDTISTHWAYAALAVDTNDYPCIACNHFNSLDSFHYIKYLYYNGILWDSSVIDDGNNLSDWGPSLAIDGKNNPHIAYYQGGDAPDSLKYVYWNGTGWVFAWTDEIGHMSEHGSLSLALDSMDYPHIAYCKWPPLWYAHWDGSIWHNEGPIDAASWEIRLDLDSLGLPHIAYIDQMGQRPEYCYRDSIAWHLCGFIEPDPYVFSYRSVSLCLDDNSEPHVAYIGSINNYNKMKYAKGTFVGINEDARYRIQDTRFRLEVYPNPSRGTANIDYALHEHSEIALSIYDVAGVMVKQIKQGYLGPGYYREKINTENLSSGVYFIVLKQDSDKVTRKFLVVK